MLCKLAFSYVRVRICPHQGCEQVSYGGRAHCRRIGSLHAAGRRAEPHEAAQPEAERGPRLRCVITCVIIAP